MSSHALDSIVTRACSTALPFYAGDEAAFSRVLSRMPHAHPTLAPADVDETRHAAAILAGAHLAAGETEARAGRLAWREAREAMARDGSTARAESVPAGDLTGEDCAESVRDRLARSATPDPAARITAISRADVLATAVRLTGETDPEAVALFRLAAACDPESWHGGLPTRDALAETAVTLRMAVDRRTVRTDVRDALATVAETASRVSAWAMHRHTPAVTWTDDGREMSDALAVEPGRPAAPSRTAATASPVVTRYRDTMSDAWLTVERVDTWDETDPETGEAVTMLDVSTMLQALAAERVADVLADVLAVEPHRPTAAMVAGDAWADRDGWTAGPVKRASRLRKGGSGSTGPTIPARLSR